jgi:hypothetical protein
MFSERSLLFGFALRKKIQQDANEEAHRNLGLSIGTVFH